ncbi:protein TsetseEP isoform X2 [Nerophis ophidion]|uniref:protein TsetseEP isoform X2 n=1 Tax=Nerophis ophidion TaxID=159077 RepID=UPI002AE09CBC|nr:protein TsetseEP isoform X2 [Nerophis ophidion]
MDQTSQPGTDYKGQDEEEQGGIRRRLRDRSLLKKRKAEAEEKETYQLESPRKRQRAEGSKRRGRPRKTAGIPESSFTQGGPAMVVLTGPEEAMPAITSDPREAEAVLTPGFMSPPDALIVVPPALNQDQSSAPASYQAPEPGPDLATEPTSTPDRATEPGPYLATEPTSTPDRATEPGPDPATEPTPAPDRVNKPDPYLATEPASAPDPAPEPDFAPDALLVLPQSQAPAPEPASVSSVVPPQVETLTSSSSQTFDQVLIEDLGPDVEADEVVVQDKGADEDTSEGPSNNESKPNQMFTIPPLSSLSVPQEYLQGN